MMMRVAHQAIAACPLQHRISLFEAGRSWVDLIGERGKSVAGRKMVGGIGTMTTSSVEVTRAQMAA